MSQERIAIGHFASIRRQLKEYAKQTGIVAEHGDVKGLSREGFVQLFLKQNLSPMVDLSSGEVIDCTDRRSGQIDIILQSSWAPRLHLHNGIIVSLNDSVIGCIEVKSNLKTGNFDKRSHLRSALLGSLRLKLLKRQEVTNESIFAHKFKRTPNFIFAYEGPEPDTLQRWINEFCTHPKILEIAEKEGFIKKGDRIELDMFQPEQFIVLDPPYCMSKNIGIMPNSDSPFVTTEGTESLSIFFFYLTRIIQNWNSSPPIYDMKKYFNPIP